MDQHGHKRTEINALKDKEKYVRDSRLRSEYILTYRCYQQHVVTNITVETDCQDEAKREYTAKVSMA
jgi:hypothetical protein